MADVSSVSCSVHPVTAYCSGALVQGLYIFNISNSDLSINNNDVPPGMKKEFQGSTSPTIIGTPGSTCAASIKTDMGVERTSYN